MSASHTPGPWRLTDGAEDVTIDYQSPGHYANLQILGPNNEDVVGCDEYDVFGPYGPSREANIRLIAAAPELLAALEALIGAMEAEVSTRKCHVNSLRALNTARALLTRLSP